MHILIPAGGRGTRLRPVTNFCPKPLLPLGDRPILTRIVEDLPPGNPVTVLVTPELEPDFKSWQQSLDPGYDIRIHTERPRSVGPNGPLIALAEWIAERAIDDDLLVMMGDSILPFRLNDFIHSRGGVNGRMRLAAYRLPSLDDASRFGVLEVGPDETVASFQEKPACPRSPWVFTGCVYVPRRLLRQIDRIAAGSPPQMGYLISACLEDRESIELFRAEGDWHDIGTIQSYLAAHELILSPEERVRREAEGNRLDGVVYVHPSATLRNSSLSNCIVGAGSRIVDAELRGCVVHPDVSIVGRLVRHALVTADGELPLELV